MTLRLKKHRAHGPHGADDAADATADTNARSGAQPPPHPTQRIPLPHNSMFVMGPATNTKWLHGIPHDKRPAAAKSPAETFQGGERINQMRIWGQGARGKTADAAGLVTHGEKESTDLLIAFGAENQMTEFDWDEYYGAGFDVVSFTTKEDK
ncbi:hypothetical protein GGX14DRAFT_581726 [Mycena pura]|uniref:Alpha-ketoglutarate-dependent dioxygenase AlkB-like domain-containing protein n=1 Tax=Mycena pura TaxID=153505 RepID=A0AAD6YUQ4_9AGAR|nr:hypothetical protein GGX14DRAFT_581726 [Mycena pura]